MVISPAHINTNSKTSFPSLLTTKFSLLAVMDRTERRKDKEVPEGVKDCEVTVD